MGEYAKRLSDGQDVKIGTAENLYYLRPDQIDLVGDYPALRSHLREFRFRFPFPFEDGIAPGDFEDYGRGFTVWGVEPPAGVKHYSVQFKADAGLLVSLPCPYDESKTLTIEDNTTGTTKAGKVHFNGFRGPMQIVMQRVWDNRWATVAKCGPCGALWRYPDLDSALGLLEALAARAENDLKVRGDQKSAETILTIAQRVKAGYETTV